MYQSIWKKAKYVWNIKQIACSEQNKQIMKEKKIQFHIFTHITVTGCLNYIGVIV